MLFFKSLFREGVCWFMDAWFGIKYEVGSIPVFPTKIQI